MIEDQFDRDLERLFKAADVCFDNDAEQFSERVMRAVKYRIVFRRITLGVCALIGGALAIYNLPAAFEHLDQMMGLNGEIATAYEHLNSGTFQIDLKWLATAIVGFVTFFATFSATQS
ncbi:MAG: hypothetical protein AAF950_07750 [Pseudomonadota bacterium]